MFLSGVAKTPTGPSFLGATEDLNGQLDQEDECEQWENEFGQDEIEPVSMIANRNLEGTVLP